MTGIGIQDILSLVSEIDVKGETGPCAICKIAHRSLVECRNANTSSNSTRKTLNLPQRQTN